MSECGSVEDIDFGYRLAEAGYTVRLDTGLSACHLKRWTVRSTILSDMRDRGIPWMQLILRYGALTNDMNLRMEYRWSIGLAYVALLALVLGFFEPRFLVAVPLAAAALTALNEPYYRFFYRKRGAAFAARSVAVSRRAAPVQRPVILNRARVVRLGPLPGAAPARGAGRRSLERGPRARGG